jgi:hypothetical protein
MDSCQEGEHCNANYGARERGVVLIVLISRVGLIGTGLIIVGRHGQAQWEMPKDRIVHR